MVVTFEVGVRDDYAPSWLQVCPLDQTVRCRGLEGHHDFNLYRMHYLGLQWPGAVVWHSTRDCTFHQARAAVNLFSAFYWRYPPPKESFFDLAY